MNTELLKEIRVLKEQLAALEAKANEPAVNQWNPKGGLWFVSYNGEVLDTHECTARDAAYGLHFETKEQAEELSVHIRKYARTFHWLKENDDGWQADWSDMGQYKYYMYFNTVSKTWRVTSIVYSQYPNTIYMSKPNANKLVELLNSGKVVL